MKNKDFLKSLSVLAASLRQVIEAEVDGFDASPQGYCCTPYQGI